MTDVRDQVLARFGRVDCLMNNAGAMVTRGLPWEDLEGWKAQVDINLWGIIHGCHAFLPGMIELPGSFDGRISSPKPALGPDDKRRISFTILKRDTANIFN